MLHKHGFGRGKHIFMVVKLQQRENTQKKALPGSSNRRCEKRLSSLNPTKNG